MDGPLRGSSLTQESEKHRNVGPARLSVVYPTSVVFIENRLFNQIIVVLILALSSKHTKIK